MANFDKNEMFSRQSSNPAFNPQFLAGERVLDGEPMTVGGAINKTAICLLLVVISAAFSWYLAAQGYMDMVQILTTCSLIVAFILGMVIIFKRTTKQGLFRIN